jgi:hypothetical protein
MRYPTVLFTTLTLGACTMAPVARSDAPPVSPAIVQFLLTSAATDFHAHRPPDLGPFRDVRIGHTKSSTGEDSYRMCGQFLSAQHAGNTEGTPFVTLKTSGYEQYIGTKAATTYCQGPSVIWDNEGDLSASLQSRLDSLDRAGP